MPFRPIPALRQIPAVILPLTAAIFRLYGTREIDGAYPLGAFYTTLDNRVWQPVGGIWYTPRNPEKVAARPISEVRIQRFVGGIMLGQEFNLANGTVVSWERIPDSVAQSLPPAQGH